MDPEGYTAVIAADPRTPQEALAEIAQTRPDLHGALLTNPALYPELREWLVQAGAKFDAGAAQKAVWVGADSEAGTASSRVAPWKRPSVIALAALVVVALVAGGTLAWWAPWNDGGDAPVAMVSPSDAPSASASPTTETIMESATPTLSPTPTPSSELSRTYVPTGFSYNDGVIHLPDDIAGSSQVFVPGVGSVSDDASTYFGDQDQNEISDFRVFTSGEGADVLLAAVATVRTPAEGTTAEIYTAHLRVYDPTSGEMLWETSGPTTKISTSRAIGLSTGDIAVPDKPNDGPRTVTFHRGRDGGIVGMNSNWACWQGDSCNPMVKDGDAAGSSHWNSFDMVLLDASYKSHAIGVVSGSRSAEAVDSNLGDVDQLVTTGSKATGSGCSTESTCLVGADGSVLGSLGFGDTSDFFTTDVWIDRSDKGTFYGRGDTWYDVGTKAVRTLPTDLQFNANTLYQGVVFGSTTDQYIAYDIATGKTSVMSSEDYPIAVVNGWTLWKSGLLQPPGEDVRDAIPAFS